MRLISMSKLENMAFEGLPLEVTMKNYTSVITELLGPQARLAVSLKPHVSPFIVWDGVNIFESPATSIDELESYLLEHRGKIQLYLGQDADGTPTENKLSVQNRMSDYCRTERSNETIIIENMETRIAVSSRRLSKDQCIAQNIPILLAQNPLWKVRQSGAKSRIKDPLSDRQQSEKKKEEAVRSDLRPPEATVATGPRRTKQLLEQGLSTQINTLETPQKAENDRDKEQGKPKSSASTSTKRDTMSQNKKRNKKKQLEDNDHSDRLNKDGEPGQNVTQVTVLENGKQPGPGRVNSVGLPNSVPKKDHHVVKPSPPEKLAPINTDDLLTSSDSQLLDLDLRDIFTLKAFVEELDNADRASLYELLPEVDTRNATSVASLFNANMQFLSALSLYKRLLGSGAYDPALISKSRNKRRRLDQWDDEKERVFNAFYGHRVDDQPSSADLSSKWSALDEMVVENAKSTKTKVPHASA